MSIYMNRAFRQSNSSLLLSVGKAIQSNVVRLRDDKFLVDSGLGTARTCTQDELIYVPASASITRFEDKVGAGNLATASDSSPPMRTRFMERFFVDLVAGDAMMKERATARFNSMVGSSDPLLVLPRTFRQNRAWLELNYIWRSSKQVKGFVFQKIQRGRQSRKSYAVGIAGFLAHLPSLPLSNPNVKISAARFTISSIDPKRKKIVVFMASVRPPRKNAVVFMNGGGMNARGMRGRTMGKAISVSSSPQRVEVQELGLTAEKVSEEESALYGNEEGIYKTQVAANQYDLLCLEGISQFIHSFIGFDPISVSAVANISMGSMFKRHVTPEEFEVDHVTVLDDSNDASTTSGRQLAVL